MFENYFCYKLKYLIVLDLATVAEPPLTLPTDPPSPSHGQTDTDTLAATGSGISHGQTALVSRVGSKFSEKDFAPSLKSFEKKGKFI